MAPIYDWEVRGTQPTSDGVDDGEGEATCFEFQVRLTPEEYEELMERRASAGARGRSFLHKGEGKTMSSGRKASMEEEHEEGEPEFVTSSGPYIEPTYFETWRHVNKNKWVAKTDFSCAGVADQNKTFDANVQLKGFLHEGPYIENSFKTCLRGESKEKWIAEEFRRNV